MSFREEMLLDFDLRAPRILADGRSGIIDNVKSLILLTEDAVIADCGKRFISVRGTRLTITFLEDERMFLEGNIEAVEFYGEKDAHE